MALAHRGPDAEGTWVDEHLGISLGHRRLSIVDLSSAGSQPMISRSGRYVIAFNGEIYNFRQLRGTLSREGSSFCSNSDTEVILNSFEFWGVRETIPRLLGMFAIAVWDRQNHELLLARDRMGEKPLYFGRVGRSICFASELKAFRRIPGWTGEIDRNAAAAYFRGNYVPAPLCIYSGLHKLLPGHFVRVRLDDMQSDFVQQPYWSLADVAVRGQDHPFDGSEDDAVDQLDKLLREVVSDQMVADVPIGALLSGGIDSSVIVAAMSKSAKQPVRTFTASFDDQLRDESSYAARIAESLGTRHTRLDVAASDALRMIPRLSEYYDEPFGDASQVPTLLVTRSARQQVTVCLTGDGGDEVFGGYNRHVQLKAIFERSRRWPALIRRIAGELALGAPPATYEWALRARGGGRTGEQVQKLRSVLTADTLSSAYLQLASVEQQPSRLVIGGCEPQTTLTGIHRWPPLRSELEQLLLVESLTSLPDDMLVKVDRAAMRWALETRVPLLDPRIVEFAWSLPLRFRIRGTEGKWILRRVLERYVPRALVDRPKQGFSPPVREWLLGPLRPWAEDLLSDAQLRKTELLNVEVVRKAWRNFSEDGLRRQQHVWGLLMFQSWLIETGSSGGELT
jgi:asparagine synthase (glutamine-hydrolysing)